MLDLAEDDGVPEVVHLLDPNRPGKKKKKKKNKNNNKTTKKDPKEPEGKEEKAKASPASSADKPLAREPQYEGEWTNPHAAYLTHTLRPPSAEPEKLAPPELVLVAPKGEYELDTVLIMSVRSLDDEWEKYRAREADGVPSTQRPTAAPVPQPAFV
jgi:hypothetical protein